ncbi:MAG: single-stranded DNA-binding protein [Chloroflexi bacterium]|nr:single-stranded DNA-binding protein [Chloroflexota bacterium]
MYQKVIIIGRLGRDPEMRYTPSGQPVTTFSVATDFTWTNQEGQQQQRTTWFRVNAWRKLAETCNQYLVKGQQVLVEGRMNPDPETGGPRVWTGNDGVARASYELTAATVKFLAKPRGVPLEEEPVIEEGAIEEEEIPF